MVCGPRSSLPLRDRDVSVPTGDRLRRPLPGFEVLGSGVAGDPNGGLLPPAYVALFGNLFAPLGSPQGAELCLTGCYVEAFEVERSR